MEVPSHVIVFGGSGDLAKRKLMPALASLAAQGRPREGFRVIGVSRRPRTNEEFRDDLRAALDEGQRAAFEELSAHVEYLSCDAESDTDLARLSARLDELPGGKDAGRLFYLALKPELFAPTTLSLARAGLIERGRAQGPGWRRLVVEKPFGTDLASARALNIALHGVLDEPQVFRIDHYLGKETVQNLIGFRFHNAIFEPLWNREHVELVQITVAENIGVEPGRGKFYDETGALRDVLQNHMLQILGLVAMEPPATLDPDAIRDQKVQVLRALHCPDPEEIRRHSVRARYSGGVLDGEPTSAFVEEEGVPPDSTTETYVSVRAEIDNWRWSGVPFLLRHGKRLPRKLTEVRVQFRTPPMHLFNRPEGMPTAEFRRMLKNGELCQVRPNVLTLTIQPRESIGLTFGVKSPGAAMNMAPAELSFDYRDRFGEMSAEAYERLLLDALSGDATLFLRADEIEASWRYADEVREGWQASNAPLYEYTSGSWGPETADELFYGCEGGWSRG